MLQSIIVGHLGADAEVQNSNGREFTTFRVAHSNRWTDNAGQQHEETIWVDCIMQGSPKVLGYLKKGQMIYASGSMSLRVYSSKKDRCMKAGVTINVARIELLGGKSDDVPSVLYTPDGSKEVKVDKYFHAAELVNSNPGAQAIEVVSRSGERFSVAPEGWVSRIETPTE